MHDANFLSHDAHNLVQYTVQCVHDANYLMHDAFNLHHEYNFPAHERPITLFFNSYVHKVHEAHNRSHEANILIFHSNRRPIYKYIIVGVHCTRTEKNTFACSECFDYPGPDYKYL